MREIIRAGIEFRKKAAFIKEGGLWPERILRVGAEPAAGLHQTGD